MHYVCPYTIVQHVSQLGNLIRKVFEEITVYFSSNLASYSVDYLEREKLLNFST